MKLQKQFTGIGEVKGMTFTQMKQTDTHYLYGVNNDGVIHYEVFKKKLVPICLDFAKRKYSETEFKEVYPKSNQFGISAWTYTSYHKAKERLTTLLN